jgi:glutathione S-transferase
MKIQKLKLYHMPASRSARVKWILHEAVGDDFEVQRISLYDAQQYSAEFIAINPNHNVPVLEITWEGGKTQCMIESAAMVAFVADAYPDKRLAPAPGTSAERADYLQMLHFGSTWMDMMLWQIRAHEHLIAPNERDPRTVARYRSKLVNEVEPQLAVRLEAAPYICGNAFTAADCVVAHSVMWARGYGLCRQQVFKRYLSLVSKRPAFLSAMADAHEFSLEIPAGKPLAGLFTG